MSNLRTQLLLSHLLLIGLMLVVIVGGVLSVFHLGRAIDRILWNNQRSVIAAQDMKDALERQDSAATFCLAGQPDRARAQYREYRAKFEAALEVEAHNITEPGERQMADDIRQQYAAYRAALDTLLYAGPPMADSQARAYYFGVLEPAFVRLKRRAQDVLDVNQAAILRADTRAKAEARLAARTGLGAAVGAFAVALIVALRMVGVSLAPLRSLARQAEDVGAGHLNQRIELHRSDEIGVLAASFNSMAGRLREARLVEEQRLRRAERMSDAAIDSLYDPVVVTDGQGCVVHLNRAAEDLFGPAGSATGLPVTDVVTDRRVTEAVDRAIHQQRVSAPEDEAGLIPLQAPAGQRVYRLRVTPMHDDESKLLGAVTVLEDVTHLRELDRLKTEFIGVASHELRTPVTSLQLSIQLLDEGAGGELTAEQRQLVAAAREDLERLERMMGDLLELTRLEAGVATLHPVPVRAGELADAAVESVRAQAESKGVLLGTQVEPDLPNVLADRGQVVRAIVNLLGNAIRHTPRGGHIDVGVRAQDRRVAFTVQDTGCGIPREYLVRVFERFMQVPGATRGGAGLGLAIAQTIARAHGGEITAESESGIGSRFTLLMPVADGPVPARLDGSAGEAEREGVG